ncbi:MULTISPECIES: hypothetical protein [unclassified Sphingomonas]|uniref:hypothetical protein n=1 Tax=unclassified Sphingomonas TaxID=196159 RepID=UPI001F58B2F5|nr:MULTISPECIES: hypothetical protein [unclassified Sphingomonas]
MSTSYDQQKRLHWELTNVELRAHATAIGLVQLCIELRRANVLEEAALERIKDAIADQVSVSATRAMASKNYRRDVRSRLDRLFAGDQEVGSAEELSFGAPQE